MKIHYTFEGDLSVVATISANVSNIDFIMRGLPGQPESTNLNYCRLLPVCFLCFKEGEGQTVCVLFIHRAYGNLYFMGKSLFHKLTINFLYDNNLNLAGLGKIFVQRKVSAVWYIATIPDSPAQLQSVIPYSRKLSREKTFVDR